MSELPSSPPNDSVGADEPSLLHTLWNRIRTTLGARDNEDLRDAIEELLEEEAKEETPSIEAGERFLLKNILQLHEKTVEDVMVPRAVIVGVELGTPLDDLIKLMSDKTHSRLPVFRETLDDVIGMVHIKDVLPKSRENGDLNLRRILREVIFAAPSMPVLDLLAQMRDTRIHLALVVDEYGGIDGLVSIEDLVEEIVGEIEDEHDEERPRLIEERKGVVIADARTTLEEFEERYGEVFDDQEREDIDTLGGLVFLLAGRVPGRGELLSHPSGIEFEVIEADPRRIHRLRLRNMPSAVDGDS
jgi:CBS domain containing-hemolysin-like protein